MDIVNGLALGYDELNNTRVGPSASLSVQLASCGSSDWLGLDWFAWVCMGLHRLGSAGDSRLLASERLLVWNPSCHPSNRLRSATNQGISATLDVSTPPPLGLD